jgi:type I restriction enzyme, S subunit
MQCDCFPSAPADWQRRTVGDIALINPRYPVDKDKEYPFVEMAAVAENFGGITSFGLRKADASGLARFRVNDILFGKITPCPENGKVALVKTLPADTGLGSTEFMVMSPRDDHDPRWLYYVLCSHEVRGRAISRMEGSTGRLRIPEDTFQRWLAVPCPATDEQSAIASLLELVDSNIRKTQASLDKGEQVQRAVLRRLLSDGIRENGTIRNRSSDPSEFAVYRNRWIPKDWSVSRVGSEFEIASGFTLSDSRRPRNNKRRYLRVANVQRAYLWLEDVAELEATDAEMISRTLQVDDLLVVEGHADAAAIGRCALVTAEAAGLTFQNHLFRLRSRGIDPRYACLWLNSEWSRQYWIRMCATSSGLNTINQRKLKAMPVMVPEVDEQKNIADFADIFSAYIECIKTKLGKLYALKKSLMQQVVGGTIRMPRLRVVPLVEATK